MRVGVVRTSHSPCCCAESVTVGLHALGYEVLLADSETIENEALGLAESCDLVIDHTDTFNGRGLYRPLVRLLLENCGARIVGSDAKACFLADNKAAAKNRLAESGIPVPPGITVRSDSWRLPEWLKLPLIMKPAFEHMSRGVKLVQSESQAYETAGRLLKSLKQPILVESYIPGRELAVSLLAGPDGLQVLPIMEWGMSEGSDPILTAKFKLRDNGGANFDLNKADLPRDLLREIEAAACRAFHALGLRDYARFDVRLSHDGTPFFLEANTTPSLEPLEAFAVSAQWAGLEYSALVDRMLWGARRRSESLPSEEGKPERIKIPVREAEIQIASGVLAPPASTIKLANLLDVRPGDEVLELGCGSALLSIAAAKLGARRVVATDLDVNALEAARQTISLNGVADRIELRAGSWYEAVRGPNSAMNHEDRFDVIIATPPQTPGQYPFGPKYGGPEGLLHLSKIVRGAPVFLKENGRLWLISISLANTNELWNLLKANFSHFSIIDETRRVFTPLEYESLSEGLYGYLCGLRAAGISDFTDEGAGCLSFRNLFIRASGPSAI